MKKIENSLLGVINLDVVKFALVGALSTVIDFGLLNVFVYFGLTLFWAIFCSYLVGSINGYIFNNKWTYHRLNNPNTFSGFVQYATISFVGLGLTELVVNILYHSFHTGLNVDKLVAVVIVFSWNFFANRVFTFRVAN